MKTLLKKFISKISNGIYFGIGLILTLLVFGLVYATYTRTTQTPVGAGSGLTASAWNDMINNMGYLKENVETKLSTNGNGSALTGLTKTQVGLGNIDNTSDLNKPISTAVQAALNLKADSSAVSCTKVPLYNQTVTSKNILTCIVISQTTTLTTSCTPSYVGTYCSGGRRGTSCSILGYLCQ